MGIKEDLEAMTNSTPTLEQEGSYHCFIESEQDRAFVYLNFNLNLRICPEDKLAPYWKAFCESAERKYGFKKPSEEESQRANELYSQIEATQKDTSIERRLIVAKVRSLKGEINKIAYNLRIKK